MPELPPDDLVSSFKSAVAHAKKLKLAPEQVFLLYGLYKQTTVGDCTEPQPKGLKVVAKSKWKAWKNKQGLQPLEAMKQYIDIVARVTDAFRPEEAIETETSAAIESLDKHRIINALERANELKHQTGDMKRAQKYEELIATLVPVIEQLEKVDEDAEIALKCVSKSMMKAVLKDAATLKQDSETLRNIKDMLSLDEFSFVKAEYERALQVHDIERKRHREIRLMQYKYQNCQELGNKDKYSISLLGHLRSYEQFSNADFRARVFGRIPPKEKMMHFTTKTIATSLTSCEAEHTIVLPETKTRINKFKREAKANFKSVLAYMGDKTRGGRVPICKPKASDANSAALSILKRGLAAYESGDDDTLRELYLQILKQLSHNPSAREDDNIDMSVSPENSSSYVNGLALLAMMLSVFPASTHPYETDLSKEATFDDVVVMWILDNVGDKSIVPKFISVLHNTKYGSDPDIPKSSNGEMQELDIDPVVLRSRFLQQQVKFEIDPSADSGPTVTNVELYLK